MLHSIPGLLFETSNEEVKRSRCSIFSFLLVLRNQIITRESSFAIYSGRDQLKNNHKNTNVLGAIW